MDMLFAFCLLLIQLTSTPGCLPEAPINDAPAREALFAMSSDAGLTWQDLDKLPAGEELPMSLCADGGQLYVGTGSGLYTGEARIPIQFRAMKGSPKHVFNVFPGRSGPYVAGDGGGFTQLDEASGRWSVMSRQLPDNIVLTVLESRSGKLIVGCDSGIFVSMDQGTSWTHVLKTGQVTKFLEEGSALLACSRGGLWRSVDDGRTWTPVNLNGASTFHIGKVSDGFIAIHHGAEFAGVRTANTVSLSTDQGKTWKPLFTRLPDELKDIHELVRIGQQWIAVSRAGVFRSADRGVTWQKALVPPAGKGGFFKLATSGSSLIALFVNGC